MARRSRPASRPAPRPGGRRSRSEARRRAVEHYLRHALRERCRAPGMLGEAIRYAALSRGKRLRPLLTLASCEAVGGRWRAALPAAAAVECVHAFSLVHDDLPAMDDDDLRRGLPSTHKRFGEAVAILAGDALLAFAFEELTRLVTHGVPAGRVTEAVRRLARASGGEELVAGQALDLAAEGRRVDERAVGDIHRRKTGALFGAAMALGGLAGGGTPRRVEVLAQAGGQLGLGFQILDDILDTGGTVERLGKRPGVDAAHGKATYPAVVGGRRARLMAQAHLDLARSILEEFRLWTRGLAELLASVETRDH